MNLQSYTYTHTHLIRVMSKISCVCFSAAYECLNLLMNRLVCFWVLYQCWGKFSNLWKKPVFTCSYSLFLLWTFLLHMDSSVLSSTDYLVKTHRQCYKFLFLFARCLVALFKHIICLFKKKYMDCVTLLEKSCFHKKFSAFNTVVGI